jgi:ATP-binding cassette subfamily B protein
MAVLVCGVVTSSVNLVIPKFIQYLIDSILPQKDIRMLYTFLLLLVPMVGVVILFTAIKNQVDRVITEKSARDLQFSVLRQLRNLGLSYYENKPAGETLSLFNNELKAVQRVYREYFPRIVQQTIFLIISMVILVMTNMKLSLIIIPCFLSYYLIGPYFEKKQSLLAREVRGHRTDYNKKLYDSVSALLELRANHAEKWDMDLLRQKFYRLRTTSLRELLFALLRGTARRLTVNMGAVVLILYGASLLQAGELTAGEFVAFMLYFFTVMGRLTGLVTMMTERRILLYQAEVLYGFSRQMPEVQEVDDPVRLPRIHGDLRFEGVGFSYREGMNVVKDFHLQVRRGEKIALVGSSGSGKSTVTKLLGRFYDPQKGDIKLDGVSIRNLSLEQLRNALGFVFQETYLFGTTIRENIRFGNPDAGEEQIIEAAKAAHAHDFIMEMPHGYDTLVGERGIKLSGGQKQRIAVARMLLKDPAIVLLDEATSALDNISEKEVQQALDRLLTGRTTIAVAHRLSTVKDYDKIAVMDQGKIVEIGNYDELMRRRGYLYGLVEGAAAHA